MPSMFLNFADINYWIKLHTNANTFNDIWHICTHIHMRLLGKHYILWDKSLSPYINFILRLICLAFWLSSLTLLIQLELYYSAVHLRLSSLIAKNSTSSQWHTAASSHWLSRAFSFPSDFTLEAWSQPW